MKVTGSNLNYVRQGDGSWRTAMSRPVQGFWSVSCRECGRRYFGWHQNTRILKYEHHWLDFHDHRHPAGWGGVTT